MAEDFSTTEVSLIYEGGIADAGEIHLYEYSRAIYNYSRLLQTIEFYRRQGVIAERISGASNTDILIKAAVQGSFIVDATVSVAERVLPFLKKVPFRVVLSFILDAVKESNNNQDISRHLAKIREKELENQSTSASARVSPSDPRSKAVHEIAMGQTATTRETLELANWARTSTNTAIQRSGISQDTLFEIASVAEADLIRQSELEPYSTALNQIPNADLARLSSKARPLLAEIGLPLRKSAENLSIGTGSKRRRIVRLNRDDIRIINSRQIEENSIELQASLKAYDRETGHGRLRLLSDDKVYSFIVPIHLRKLLNGPIAVGMNRASMTFIAQTVRDKSGSITSFIISGADNYGEPNTAQRR